MKLQSRITSLARLARRCHRALVTRQELRQVPELPEGLWRRCVLLWKQSERARRRGWNLAAERLADDYYAAIGALASQLGELARQGGPPVTSGDVSYRDIYSDLIALDEEFERVEFDQGSQQLRVRTAPIMLAEIYLGPFEIRLELGRLDIDLPYAVVALDPCPAASRSEVPHPHILGEVLCEGDGRQAIRRALADGRLFDFFQLVVAVLGTYNDESPYVELGDWHSEPCPDCGLLIDPENGVCCGHCEALLCYECEGGCPGCGEGYCHQCLAPCRQCDEPCCPTCLQNCKGCDRQCCSQCLTNERCGECYEEEKEQCESDPEILAPGLGQAALPA